MNNLNKKQKTILIIIATIAVIAVCVYSYAKEETSINIEDELIIENKTEEKNTIDENKTIFVHITGCVQIEGVYELEENCRIKDVIEKAGGLKEDADLTDINLAEIIEDGMKIHIPSKNETIEKEQNTTTNTISQNVSTTKPTKININKATQEELETLPGIGPSTASKIIEYRKENGKFSSIEQIKEVKGIGEGKYKKIKDYIVAK